MDNWFPISCRDFHEVVDYKLRGRPVRKLFMAGYVSRASKKSAGLVDRTNVEVKLCVPESSYDNYIGRFIEVYGHGEWDWKGHWALRVTNTVRYDPSIGRELALYYEAMHVSRRLEETEEEWLEKSAPGTQTFADLDHETQGESQPQERFYSLCRLNSSIRGSDSFEHIPWLDEIPEPEEVPEVPEKDPQECGSSGSEDVGSLGYKHNDTLRDED